VLSALAVTALVIAAAATGCGLHTFGVRPTATRSKLAVGSALGPKALMPGNLAHVAVALQPFTTGLTNPVQLTYAPDESGRVYIAEQAGLILVADANGQAHAQPFLDITPLVLSGGERGVLSVAFHPHYKANGLFFVTYTNLDGDTVLARYQVSKNPLRADPTSARVYLLIHQLGGEHKSGQLFFGRDGYLYMTVGDGALGGGAVYGQRKDTLLGKILRLDVDHTSPGKAYAIPPDNPFVHDPTARGEIWAYGLRNPWRFSFDRATGDLYLGDVGEFSSEEIDVLRAGSHGGANFGWDYYEGTMCKQANCSQAGLVMPIVAYTHLGGLCAVMGGYVYRGTRSPALDGMYLYADYCSGRVFGLVAADARPGQTSVTRLLFDLHASVSSFGEDEAGELYVVGYLPGTIYHVTATQTP
jgi:glucose/arabinose dehydrogenase